MNEDILNGKWLEIKGLVQEKWGILADNDLDKIEGKNQKLFGLSKPSWNIEIVSNWQKLSAVYAK